MNSLILLNQIPGKSSSLMFLHKLDTKIKFSNFLDIAFCISFTTISGRFSKFDTSNTLSLQISVFGKSNKKLREQGIS